MDYLSQRGCLWLHMFFLDMLITLVSAQVPYVAPNAVAEGRRHYEELVSQTPRYGPCWRRAIEDLEVGCKHLTDDVQGRLAFEFTNCLLQQMGQRVYFCPKNEPLFACEDARILQRENFPTFTTFFTHAQVICSFLEGQAWQERAEMTIASLSETSVKVNEGMMKAGRVQEDLLRLQQMSISAQKDMIEQLKSEFGHVANWATQQQKLLAEAFEQVTKLHDFVVSLFSTVYAFGYYFGAMVASYVMTATKRTSGARYWMFLLFTGNLVVERMLANTYGDKEMDMPVILSRDGPVQQKVALCRKIFCVMAAVVLLWFGATYRDYMEVNHKILLTLQKDFEAYIKNSGQIANNIHTQLFDPEESSDREYSSEEDGSFVYSRTSQSCSETSESDESYVTESGSLTPDVTFQSWGQGVKDVLPKATISDRVEQNGVATESSISGIVEERSSPSRYNLRPRLSRGTPNQEQKTKGSNLGILSSDEE